ncbi:hypothetical protein N8I77_002162 [Diaporthe amygdali]|uniref:Uncharacterized protein n=1 Tax=Phomopsis amygdali TaxID=1214568 RepID=A0AAD9STC8_PHOAM|nr:hypothetical protein N8I77_002162 [Diaporthe amygdali]
MTGSESENSSAVPRVLLCKALQPSLSLRNTRREAILLTELDALFVPSTRLFDITCHGCDFTERQVEFRLPFIAVGEGLQCATDFFGSHPRSFARFDALGSPPTKLSQSSLDSPHQTLVGLVILKNLLVRI